MKCFTVTPLAAIADTICGTFQIDPVEVSRCRLRLLDTVDGRLAARGWRLEAEPLDGTAVERWRLVDRKGRVQTTAEFPSPTPALADDLPPGPLRDALEAVIWIRALVPGPMIDLTEHRASLRDPKGKVRCRLIARSALVEGTDDCRSKFRVEPLRGFRGNAQKIEARVSAEFGWPSTPDDPLTALSKAMAAPVEPVEAPSISDPSEPAGSALRPVLLHLLDTIERRSQGVIADIDCEELHELRVAIRRSRSILSLLRSPAQNRVLEGARKTFAWLGQITGPTRDLDVHILAWRAHRRTTSAEEVKALAPLGAFLVAERDKAHAVLVRTLRSRRFRDALARWRTALEKGDEAWTRSETLQASISELAGRRIRKLHRRALREGAGIAPDTPAEALHMLRKTVKKIRYLVEIIENIYSRKRVRAVLGPLRELQQVLGEVQDMEVQADALRNYGHVMAQTGRAGPATLMAIGAMAEDLEIRRAEARARFVTVFQPIAKPKFRKRLHALAPRAASPGRGDGE